MTDETYDVEAKIDVKTDKSRAGVRGLVRDTLGVEKSATRAGFGIMSAVSAAVGFAGAYFSVRALASGFTGLTATAFEYSSVLSKQQTSLSAVLAATQPMFAGISDGAERMTAAGKLGGAIFRQLQDDALKSVATSQEMFSIYSSIAGPLAGAGAKLSEIKQITNDTVSAASVLGVDFGQASRDIMLMASGAAGMDTALFRMLKATGRITESTQEWNQMLPEKRLARIKESLAGFAPAAKEFEKSLPGITSSFVDFMQRFRGAFFSGPLDSIRKSLIRFVGIFSTYQDRIISILTTAGNMFSAWLDPVLEGFAGATEYFLNNWEMIARRIEETWRNIMSWGHFAGEKAAKFAPAAKAVGVGYAVNKVGSAAVGGSLAGAASSAVGAKVTAGLKVLFEFASAMRALGGLFTYVLLPLTILMGLFGAMIDVWDSLAFVLAPIGAFVQDIFGTLWVLLQSIAAVIWPLAKIVGVVLLTAFVLVGGIILAFAKVFWFFIKTAIEGWVLVFTYIGEWLTTLYGYFTKFFEGIAAFMGKVLDIGYGVNAPNRVGGQSGGEGWLDNFMKKFNETSDLFGKQKADDEGLMSAAEDGNNTKAKKTVVNDFRGSKIEVKQDFRDADPDRIWDQMVAGINKGADQRIASAVVPSFTR